MSTEPQGVWRIGQAYSGTNRETPMSWVQAAMRAFTPLGPSDWGNLIAP